MDFLLLTRAAGVLPPPRSYCHNRTWNDSRATQPPKTRLFVLFWRFFFHSANCSACRLRWRHFLTRLLSSWQVFRQKAAAAGTEKKYKNMWVFSSPFPTDAEPFSFYRLEKPPAWLTFPLLSPPLPLERSLALVCQRSTAKRGFFSSLFLSLCPPLPFRCSSFPRSWIPIGAVVLDGAAGRNRRFRWHPAADGEARRRAPSVGGLLVPVHCEAFMRRMMDAIEVKCQHYDKLNPSWVGRRFLFLSFLSKNSYSLPAHYRFSAHPGAFILPTTAVSCCNGVINN